MATLVTGGAGFLGSHLCERLLAQDQEVLCMDNFFTGRRSNVAHLLDNPNFNKKIPTDVEIRLTGNLTKPNSPDFEIYFPNTSSTVTSEINYKFI